MVNKFGQKGKMVGLWASQTPVWASQTPGGEFWTPKHSADAQIQVQGASWTPGLGVPDAGGSVFIILTRLMPDCCSFLEHRSYMVINTQTLTLLVVCVRQSLEVDAGRNDRAD
jgi:hypothetical protein